MADFQTAYEVEGLAFDDTSGILTGDSDPKTVSPGVGIPNSTLYIRKDNNTLYQKVGPLSTDWVKISANRHFLKYSGRGYLNSSNAKGFNITYGTNYRQMNSNINLNNIPRTLTGFKIPFNSIIKKITLSGRASSSNTQDFDVLFLTQIKDVNTNTVISSSPLGLKNIVTTNTRNQIYTWTALDFSGLSLIDTQILSMVFRKNNNTNNAYFLISSLEIELEEIY